jgi:hypothetical protein
LGEIEELVLDIHSSASPMRFWRSVAFGGSKNGCHPWSTVTVDRVYQRCVINVELERLIGAKSRWRPVSADGRPSWYEGPRLLRMQTL